MADAPVGRPGPPAPAAGPVSLDSRLAILL